MKNLKVTGTKKVHKAKINIIVLSIGPQPGLCQIRILLTTPQYHLKNQPSLEVWSALKILGFLPHFATNYNSKEKSILFCFNMKTMHVSMNIKRCHTSLMPLITHIDRPTCRVSKTPTWHSLRHLNRRINKHITCNNVNTFCYRWLFTCTPWIYIYTLLQCIKFHAHTNHK